MTDSLQRFVDARDRALTEQRVLDRNKREHVDRRVCSACWRTMLPRRLLPELRECPWCSGKLHEVTL